MNEVLLAFRMANRLHEGQLDKAGKPYILHPVEVSMSDYIYGYGDTIKIIALLHDVLEDTNVSEEVIENMFGSYVLLTISLLTHRPKDDYFRYVDRIANSGNKDAIRVKLADLEHNSRIDRIKEPTEKDFKRVEKYKKAMEILKSRL